MSKAVERNSAVTMFVNMDQLQVAFEKSEAKVKRFENALQKLKDEGKTNSVAFAELTKKLEATKIKTDEYEGLI